MSIRDEINQKLDTNMLNTYEDVEKSFFERCEKISESFFKEVHDKLLEEADKLKGNPSANIITISKWIDLGYEYDPDGLFAPSQSFWLHLPFLFKESDQTDKKVIDDFCSFPSLEETTESVYVDTEVEKGILFKRKETIAEEHIVRHHFINLPRSYVLLINKLKKDVKKLDDKIDFIIEPYIKGTSGKFIDNETYKILLDDHFDARDFNKFHLGLCITIKYQI